MLSARILHTILPLIGYSQVSRGLCSNQFKGFNQVLIASSSLRKGLVDLFYPNAIEDFNDTSVYYIMEVHNSRDSFPNNIQSPHFQHFVSTCEDLLTQVSDLAEFKSLYPPKENWFVPPEAVDAPTPTSSTRVTNIAGLMAICVDISIQPEHVNQFIEITCSHCSACSNQPDTGIVRMDFIQSSSDSGVFKLLVYTDREDGLESHRNSEDYKKWTADISPMCSQPRSSRRLVSVFPDIKFMRHSM